MGDNDIFLDVAYGRNRNEMHWKNKEVLWSELLDRIRTTHRTSESFSVYMASTKDRKAEIKDIGGFVGGYMNTGRRKTGSVVHRQLLTLDLDFAKITQWRDFAFMYDNTALMYSTHSHSKGEPKYRLVMPLSRPVSSVEYQAVGRRIAGNLGIEYFDNTGFQYERLMYWPSTSADGVYEFYEQSGDWLNVDEVLQSYVDWTNIYEWPISERYTHQLREGMAKAGHPPDKPGAIGAFCSAYSISKAIDKFLTETYIPCDVDNRYTYVGGTTSAGLVTYDDLYAYSHHGTDPASGKLCNAYDLVRLHKFGHLDEDVKSDTPINKLPSSGAMAEYAVQDKAVVKLIVDHNIARAQASEDFKAFIVPEVIAQVAADIEEEASNSDVDPDAWKGSLDVGKTGDILSTINNVLLVMENDPYLRGRFAFDEFSRREVALKPLPWRNLKNVPAPLIDVDDAGLRFYLEKSYNITSIGKIDDGVKLALLKNSFHPVRDYLDACIWDGTNRLDTFLIDYLGAEDTEYVRTVTRKALIAAVARIYDPGCKFDHAITLIGDEGIGKSTIFYNMAPAWFTDSIHTVTGKEAYEQLQGVWLVEIAELSGFRRADAEAIKAFISARKDRYRVAYGRRVEDFPRQVLMICTTNKRNFLISEDGNRRFWPVICGITKPLLDFMEIPGHVASLIWAEACEAYRGGEELKLPKHVETVARMIQLEHTENDDRAGAVEDFVNMLLPEDWDDMLLPARRNWLNYEDAEFRKPGTKEREKICAAEIWCELFGGNPKEMTNHNTKFIHVTLAKLPGWKAGTAKRTFGIYGKQKSYNRLPVVVDAKSALL